MTSTPRLDSLTAGATGAFFTRIRLADGHALSLNIRPGAGTADEVLLLQGLTAPDTEAWRGEGQWEVWLSGGIHGEGTLYLVCQDVPVDAVRDLILQHGGEHEDQESQEPAPGAEDETREEAALEQLRFPGLLADIADLHGRFKGGYSAADIREVFARIYDTGGPYLVCVWDYADAADFGGKSQFYAEEWDGDFYKVRPDIHLWLSGQQETPGPVDTWLCDLAEPMEFPVNDDSHNYARTDRTGD
ncbi:hypothetical protein [Streptomyces noursei]|uniref:hypothetical protein n=1 Tax=Streptomyces noursei TaxID=1971 RepID=UPI0016764944|nr:hypothetical protein [Streptomyces noursei]MCZ1021460.1 hypothetical protein [Streptomyces noursei]GGX46620.1 hypothetical protein GCM10010341_80490 [Streptomyces noursei]